MLWTLGQTSCYLIDRIKITAVTNTAFGILFSSTNEVCDDRNDINQLYTSWSRYSAPYSWTLGSGDAHFSSFTSNSAHH